MRTGLPRTQALFVTASVVGCVFSACTDTTAPAPTGTLDVSVTTAGAASDPDGFAILVDDLQRKSLPGAGHAVITGLVPGRHSVKLDSLAPDCEVTTGNPLTVEIEGGASASLTFDVTCTPPTPPPPPPPTGSLRVISQTTGTSLDPDGYRVWVDRKPAGGMAIDDTLTLAGLAGGDHSVELRDIASNCVTTGPSSLIVTVTPPDTTILSLAVVCTTPGAGPATIEVTVTTQVVSVPAPLQYTVVLDGKESQTVPSNGVISFSTVAGTHSVRLKGYPSYCAVGFLGLGSANPATVTVLEGRIATVRFGVFCFP